MKTITVSRKEWDELQQTIIEEYANTPDGIENIGTWFGNVEDMGDTLRAELEACRRLLEHLGDESTIRVLDERNRAMVAMQLDSVCKVLGE